MSTASLKEKDSPVFAFSFCEPAVPEKIDGYYDEALEVWITPQPLNPVAVGTEPYDTITTIVTGLPGGGSQMDDNTSTDYHDEEWHC